MAKRPSAPSIRSKQHQVLRYIYSTDPKTVARDYNVSTEKLRQFAMGNPKRMKSRVLKDPVFRRFYESDPREIAKQNDVKLIPRLTRKRYIELRRKSDLERREKLAIEYRTVTKTREYKVTPEGKVTYPPLNARQIQMQQARKELEFKDLGEYTNKKAVQEGLQEGLLTPSDVRTIVSTWQEDYAMEDDAAQDMLEELMEGYVEEGEE